MITMSHALRSGIYGTGEFVTQNISLMRRDSFVDDVRVKGSRNVVSEAAASDWSLQDFIYRTVPLAGRLAPPDGPGDVDGSVSL